MACWRASKASRWSEGELVLATDLGSETTRADALQTRLDDMSRIANRLTAQEGALAGPWHKPMEVRDLEPFAGH